MGLLHSLTTLPAKANFWELIDLAQEITDELGIPLPPEVTKMAARLSDAGSAVGSGNPADLLKLIGPDVAAALGVELNNPVLEQLLTGQLDSAKNSLLNYISNLTGLDGRLTDQMHDLLGDLGGLQNLRGQLDGLLNIARDLPGALSSITGLPVLSVALGQLAQVSPELANILRTASETADQLDSRMTSTLNRLDDVTEQLDKLTDLRSLGQLALGQLEQHAAELPEMMNGARRILGAMT